MKTISYEFHKELRYGAFLITEEDYENHKEIKGFKTWDWRFDFRNEFKNGKHYYIERPYGDSRETAVVIVEQINTMLESGFTLTSYAQKQYEYWNSLYKEIKRKEQEERERRERARLQQLIEANKRPEAKQFYWCDKYGCQTKEENCEVCKLKYQIGCHPRRIKATKNESGDWVAII